MSEEWKNVLLKVETHDRLKKKSLESGVKMWALMERYVPKFEVQK